MIIEGKNPTLEALNSGKAVYKVYLNKNLPEGAFSKILTLAKKLNIKVEFIDRIRLDALSKTKNHQGVIAEMEDFSYSTVDEILNLAKNRNEPPFVVILDGVEDPHNLGSIVRVCDCAGAHGIIIPKHNACPINETVAKVSAGALEHVLLARVTNINNVIEELKKLGIFVYAAELSGTSLFNENLTGAICVVIGSEGRGVSVLTKKLCDGVVTIPQNGKVNSLNASVACGVVLFEIVRQRGAK